MDTAGQSALEVDSERKIACRTRDSNPHQYFAQLFTWTLHQNELSLSLTGCSNLITNQGVKWLIDLLTNWPVNCFVLCHTQLQKEFELHVLYRPVNRFLLCHTQLQKEFGPQAFYWPVNCFLLCHTQLRKEFGSQAFYWPVHCFLLCHTQLRKEFGPQAFYWPVNCFLLCHTQLRKEFGPQAFYWPVNCFLLCHTQLRKEFGPQALPTFPPKKLLSLAAHEVEERRGMLERYIQLGKWSWKLGKCIWSALSFSQISIMSAVLTHLAPDQLLLFRYEIPCEGK